MSQDLAAPDDVLGAWTATADDLDAVQREPVLMPLGELGMLEVSGADAVAFLQAQLTNDVAQQDETMLRLAGYCTPKGRLLAVFFQWRVGDTILLQLPRDIVASVAKRLKMFVLRSKVRIDDVSDAWRTYALCGPRADEILAQAGFEVPDAPGVVRGAGPIRVARVRPSPRVQARFVLLVPAADAASVALRLPVRTAASGAWWWTQVDAAVPTVVAATQEKFVPQMVNLEVLGGVSFKKGCYPGQEVVARSQYLGKLRRRMHVAHIDGETRAGADVYAAGDSSPVGVVVMAAAAPGGGMDLLFECPSDRTDGRLYANAVDGPPLVVRPLPYELFDPTA